MKLLTKIQQESYENAKCLYVCKEILEDKYAKLETIVVKHVNIEVCYT